MSNFGGNETPKRRVTADLELGMSLTKWKLSQISAKHAKTMVPKTVHSVLFEKTFAKIVAEEKRYTAIPDSQQTS